MTRLEAQLLLHEGLRLEPYVDTEGNSTVGIGYNITGRGLHALEKVIKRKFDGRLTEDEAFDVLRADIARTEQAIIAYFPEYTRLDPIRQRVVLDMTFNMGTAVLTFRQAIAAVKRRDWTAAARELYRSKWAHQVGDGEGGKFDRADRLARMILTGHDYME